MIIPCGHRLLIKPYKLEDVDDHYKAARQAGIVIAELDGKKREEQAVDRGTVISIADGAFKDLTPGTPWCKLGDSVMFARYAGKRVKDVDDVEYVIVNDEDVICVIKESK